MPRGNWKVCRTCNGSGKVYNPVTKKKDATCTACGGAGGIYTGLV